MAADVGSNPFAPLSLITNRKPRLLICGSREATPEMLKYAADAAFRALDKGWQLIVGDASGVDEAVVKRHWDYIQGFTIEEAPYLWCYGITVLPRNCVNKRFYIHLPFLDESNRIETEKPHAWTKAFYRRDEYMVERADGVLAVWNGVSGGTRHTFEHAQKLGKPVFVKDYKAVQNSGQKPSK